MNFIDPQSIPDIIYTKQYDTALIALSVSISIIASYSAFGTSERVYSCKTLSKKLLWVSFGAITMGIGIWAMHFIGSLALILPVPITYDLGITLLSIVPAFIASAAVLWLVTQNTQTTGKSILSGTILGTGVGTMHYVGMAAMQVNASMLYIKPVFFLSILIAVVLATIALKIKFYAINHHNYEFLNKAQALSATVMGVAISGMHFTGMRAVEYVPIDVASTANTGIPTPHLTALVGLTTFLVLTVGILLPLALRLKEITIELKKNEESLIISATAFHAHDAIAVIDKQKQIIRVNKSFIDITGYSEMDVLQQSLSFLQEEQSDESLQHEYWTAAETEGNWSGELWKRRKNGDVFLSKHTITAVRNTQDETTHYVVFFSDITKEKLAEKEVEKLAFFDHLTDLPNRRLLYQRLEHELSIAKRYHRTGILLFMDLDRFKQINDSLGHSAGDDLLIQTAVKLQSLLRETDTAARIGGDEFVILISAQGHSPSKALTTAQKIAEKVIRTINAPYLINNKELFVSTSIGITLFNGENETRESLLKKADTAMYYAKDAGRDTFRFYESNMQDHADATLLTETCLRTALVNNELSIHYQPQVLNNNVVVGAEALLRWNNPDLGQVSPVDFIPIAEETGLIRPIGQWVIESCCELLNQLDEKGIHLPHIAINISAKQLLEKHFAKNLLSTATQYNISPERLLIEITESVFIQQIDAALYSMNALKTNGFKLSIDDFGTGYSSLSYLKQLPFDQLKIDQAFTQGISIHKSDTAIVKAIIIMAEGLGLNVIAEGTETKLQVDLLTEYGCKQFQGYFFSRPLAVDKFIDYLSTDSITLDT